MARVIGIQNGRIIFCKVLVGFGLKTSGDCIDL